MSRLKNRQHGIPGGFQFFQPETSFDAPRNLSFDGVTQALIKHRLGNPWLIKKHGWSTDYNSVADEVDAYNTARLEKNPRWSHFIDGSGGSSASSPFHFLRPDALRSAAGSVKKTLAGVGVLLRWLGSGGRAVPKEQAERRASVCVQCPFNQPGDLATWFTEAASGEILKVFGIMSDLKLATSQDGKLGVCSACLCPLRSKVWTPLPHILAEMSDQVKGQLHQDGPRCWILGETP